MEILLQARTVSLLPLCEQIYASLSCVDIFIPIINQVQMYVAFMEFSVWEKCLDVSERVSYKHFNYQL